MKQQFYGQGLTVMQDARNRVNRGVLHRKVDAAARAHKARIDEQLPVTKRAVPQFLAWMQVPENRAWMDRTEGLARALRAQYRAPPHVIARRRAMLEAP